MLERKSLSAFEQTILPHLDAAHNLARWLTRDDADAEDIVQEACLRAFKFFGSYRGENSRSWLLAIVRNTYFTWRQQNRIKNLTTAFDEEVHGTDNDIPTPEAILVNTVNVDLLKDALEKLPDEYREVVILREKLPSPSKICAPLAHSAAVCGTAPPCAAGTRACGGGRS